jgi:HemY protein
MKSDPKEAINLIEKAISFKGNFAPYIKLYTQLLFNTNNNAKALKVLKKYWTQSPSSLLRSSISEVLKENKINEIEFINRLVSKNQNNEESKKLLIDFAIYFNNWSMARDNIKGLLGSNPSREICLFMSDIELGEFNNIQKSEGWKLRANNAGSDYYWVCKFTNNPQKKWTALSDSGYFNSLEWVQPKMLSVS